MWLLHNEIWLPCLACKATAVVASPAGQKHVLFSCEAIPQQIARGNILFFIEQSNQRAICRTEDECQTSGTRALRNKTNPVCASGFAGRGKVERRDKRWWKSRLHRSASLPGFLRWVLGKSRPPLVRMKKHFDRWKKRRWKGKSVIASILLSCFLSCQTLCNIRFCCNITYVISLLSSCCPENSAVGGVNVNEPGVWRRDSGRLILTLQCYFLVRLNSNSVSCILKMNFS